MFDQQRAYLLAQICQLAYEEYPTTSKNIHKALGNRLDIYPMSVKNTQAVGIVNDKELIIAFRGTEPDCINDWLTDIRIKKINGIHRGFYRAYKDIKVEIEQLIKDSWTKKIFLTGHSLGGALASICALDLIKTCNSKWINGIYTFGAPRCFDKNKAKIYDELYGDRTYRVVNNNDIVTRIPTRLMGFSHTKNIVYIDNDNKIHTEDNAYNLWQTFWDRIEGRLESLSHLRIADGIDDHAIAKYIKLLKP
ncbi:MAG: lipase family protein, partial [Bacillota bacterium]